MSKLILPFFDADGSPPMVQLQRLTGMRSTELCELRGIDLDTAGDVWVYRPAHHKNAHRGKEYCVCIGPKAQTILKDWLRDTPEEYVFSPREAMKSFRALQRSQRKTKVQPSQRYRKKRNPKKVPGCRYTFRSYGEAVTRGL